MSMMHIRRIAPSAALNKAMKDAQEIAKAYGNLQFGANHLIYALADKNENFNEIMEALAPGSVEVFMEQMEQNVLEAGKFSVVMTAEDPNIEMDAKLNEAISNCVPRVGLSNKSQIDIVDVLDEVFEDTTLEAGYYLQEADIETEDLLRELQKYPEFGELAPKVSENPFSDISGMTSGKPTDWKEFCGNLSEEVKTNPVPFVGRGDVLDRTMQILSRKTKNNPVHIGAPGVGKTAITKELASMINSGDVPENLQGATVWSLEMGKVVAGTRYRGDFEERMTAILDGISKEKNPILYIDEIHMLVGAGSGSDSAMDASNILKPYLTKGNIKFIGATTDEEYKKYFEKDKALMRRFQSIQVKEPTIDEAIQILDGVKGFYEDFHHVTYTKEAISSACELSAKYITERFLPDKAIDVLDEAGAYATMEKYRHGTTIPVVDKDIIEKVMTSMANVPLESVTTSETTKLLNLADDLKKVVFGQEAAIDSLVDAIKLSKVGLMDENKPIGSFLFVGPTGVGKTEIAKQLSNNLSIPLLRFDMSEYSEKHSVSKFIGSPAGYVGYEDGGLLVESIRKNPHSVLLLDEIEKAHPVIFDSLLQIMDNATLSDNKGRKADFRNVIIIMTSNAGARKVGRSTVAFGGKTIDNTAIDEAVKNTFSPEFRNRITKTIVFNDITNTIAEMIVEKNLKLLAQKLIQKQYNISWTKATIQYIVENGVGKEYGAREIARIIDSEIKPLFVEKLLTTTPTTVEDVKIDRTSKEFVLV